MRDQDAEGADGDDEMMEHDHQAINPFGGVGLPEGLRVGLLHVS